MSNYSNNQEPYNKDLILVIAMWGFIIAGIATENALLVILGLIAGFASLNKK